jgi:hypothetical protein
MKRILVIGSIVALSVFGVSASASAAPADAQCFGQIHATINTDGFGPYTNVSQVVKELGGQGKKALASSLCGG